MFDRSITLDRWMARAEKYDLYFFTAMLALLSFSLPGREGPNSAGGIDVVALAKLGIRVVACGYFALLFLRLIQRGSFRVSSMYVPWILFAGWSLLSVAWSALPVVSIGQWLGLVALLAMSQTIAWRYSDAREMSWIDMIVWIHGITFVYCAAVMAAHLVSPHLSGLDRQLWISGSNGLVHPTAAGATSSLGVLLGVYLYARRLPKPQLTKYRVILVAMILVELSLLYSSKSRAALLMTVICLLVYGVFLTSWRARGVTVLTIGLALLATITIDPGFELIGGGIDGVGNYIKRGQTADDLKNASGRSEMWAAIGAQIETSPALGHGYFVTSSNGKLDVWQGPSNQDAHNIFLQVLVTTGFIGMIPFLWALCRMARGIFAERDGDFYWLVLLVGIWYAGWGQGCVTFLGPVRPESVVFFVVLGLLAGRVDWRQNQAMTQREVAAV